jgi:helicase
VLLAEPGGSYSRESRGTEEEIALKLLKGEMEEVAPVHDLEQSSEEFVANAVACGGEEADLARINTTMVGSMEPVLPELVAHKLVHKEGTKLVLSPLARVMSEHFIGLERLLEIMHLAKELDDPLDIIAELESERIDDEPGKKEKEEKGGKAAHGHKKGHGRR